MKATQQAKKEWKETRANLDCSVEVYEEGFQDVAGPSTYRPKWGEVTSVFQSESLLIFCDEGMERALLIPKRAFISEQQFKEFLDLIYQRTVLDQKGPESTQSVGSTGS